MVLEGFFNRKASNKGTDARKVSGRCYGTWRDGSIFPSERQGAMYCMILLQPGSHWDIPDPVELSPYVFSNPLLYSIY